MFDLREVKGLGMQKVDARQDWGWEQTGPVWGARAFAPKSGQDHLGLGSVSSDRILPRLSPGINVLTIHPRYWTFYSWVLSEFWAAELPRTRAAFRDFYRPREALFSMACHLCDATEHETLVANIVGSRRVSPLVHEDEFDPQFDYIKEPLGGFGLYYRSAMEMTGALVVAGPSNGFPFDAPTPIGRALAAAFAQSIHNTEVASILDSGATATVVSRAALMEFARKACLCQLRAGSQDLPLLQDLFLHSGTTEETSSRSETLRMLLDLSACAPTEPIGQDEYRQLIYFRDLNGSLYIPRPELIDVARRWRVYQGREYFAYAFNRLLRWASRRGLAATDGGLTPLPIRKLWEVVDAALDDSVHDADMDLALREISSTTKVNDVVAYLRAELPVGQTADQVWARRDDLDEHALYYACRYYDEDDGSTLVALLCLILLVRERFGLPNRALEYADEQDLVAEGGSLRIGMTRFMTLLNRRMLTDPTLGELARWIIEDFVIVQHERVATAKLPEDTYRVRRVGDALRFFAQEAPAVFNDSRFNALSTTVHELGWVSTFREPHRKLTPAGRQLLRDGDMPTGALTRAAIAFVPTEDSET